MFILIHPNYKVENLSIAQYNPKHTTYYNIYFSKKISRNSWIISRYSWIISRYSQNYLNFIFILVRNKTNNYNIYFPRKISRNSWIISRYSQNYLKNIFYYL